MKYKNNILVQIPLVLYKIKFVLCTFYNLSFCINNFNYVLILY